MEVVREWRHSNKRCCGDAGAAGVERTVGVGVEVLCRVPEGFGFRFGLRSKLPKQNSLCIHPNSTCTPAALVIRVPLPLSPQDLHTRNALQPIQQLITTA